MIDHRPALILRCASVDDVVTAVRIARESDLEIGVRCGGHNIAGLAVPHGGLMIDLTGLDRITVDPVTLRARVQGGAMLGALDRATQAFGLATTAGNVSHTGVGGLTLGGGMGWLARLHGLACDNVVSCTVVTADGGVVRASAEEHPDLFWGLRGGGGNFGIVVEFEFRLHPVGTRAVVAELAFGLEHAAGALRGWRDLAEDAPRQATLTAEISDATVTLGYVWVGDPEQSRGLLTGLRSIGTPDSETVRELSYLTLQTRDDDSEGHSYRRYWKGHYLPELSDGAIGALLDRDPADATTPGVSLQAYGGAIADVDDDATAFSHRHTRFEYVASVQWTDPDEDSVRMAAARRAAAKLDHVRRGRVRQRAQRRGRLRRTPRLPRRPARPPDRGQGRVRPGQRLSPQPQHRPQPPVTLDGAVTRASVAAWRWPARRRQRSGRPCCSTASSSAMSASSSSMSIAA
jgi:hypothetical protein